MSPTPSMFGHGGAIRLGGRPPKGVTVLLLLMAAAFLGFVLARSPVFAFWTGLSAQRTFKGLEIFRPFASLFYSGQVERVEVIQVLGSGVVIWILGSLLERFWGTLRLVLFVLVTGIAANLAACLASYGLWSDEPVGGMGGAASAVVVAAAVVFRGSPITIWLLNRPWSIKTIHLLYVYLGIVCLGALVDGFEGLSLARYLGYSCGGLTALLFVYEGWRPWVLLRRRKQERMMRENDLLLFPQGRIRGKNEKDPFRWN